MRVITKRIRADEDVMDEAVDDVTVAPEASDLLFEAEDVAELVAEVTGMPVDVVAEDDKVEFTVGEETFTVEAEGNEELLESATKIPRGRKPVTASTRKPAARARKSVNSSARVFRKIPSGK